MDTAVTIVVSLIIGAWAGYLLCRHNTYDQRICTHERQRAIHGDDIYMVGMNRARCVDCAELLPNTPPEGKNAGRTTPGGEPWH